MNYCITNGWLNPLLNKLKFFRRLEAVIRFFGIETARAKDATLHRERAKVTIMIRFRCTTKTQYLRSSQNQTS